MHPDARRILIVNGKGGCGKTTIATNLAVAYANREHNVALIDNDPQAASTYWGSQRSAELAKVKVIPAHARASMYETQVFHDRVAPNASRIIVDGQSTARDRDLESLMRQADVVLIPILPSAIDMHVGQRFITELLTHRAYRSAPRPVAVVANRVQPNTDTHRKLEHFLSCLDLPCVATFRDSPIYTQVAECGEGVVDQRANRAARKETANWWRLADWIDAQEKHARVTVRELRLRPLEGKGEGKGEGRGEGKGEAKGEGERVQPEPKRSLRTRSPDTTDVTSTPNITPNTARAASNSQGKQPRRSGRKNPARA